jgi:two-component system NarL family response regulator
VIRVVVDGQRLFAEGLSRIVTAQEGVGVVGAAHDGESGIALCLRERPDVVLMAISMPVMDCVTATRQLRERLPGAKVLILTVHADDVHVFRGIKARASGYLLKDCTLEDLSRAVRTVHAGDTIMAPEIARKMLLAFEEAGEREEPEAPKLTEREMQILVSLSRGRARRSPATSPSPKSLSETTSPTSIRSSTSTTVWAPSSTPSERVSSRWRAQITSEKAPYS